MKKVQENPIWPEIQQRNKKLLSFTLASFQPPSLKKFFFSVSSRSQIKAKWLWWIWNLMRQRATTVKFRSIIQFSRRPQVKCIFMLSVSGWQTRFVDSMKNSYSISFAVKQTSQPKILFKKKLFVVGENLIANCTTTRAKPHPHITWLINGKKVKRNKNPYTEKNQRQSLAKNVK